mmetsp:Transcript_40090/g.121194  ORF Transcript_40090/g.121194 Transcript_40090/m.121194 type:complete len:247 (+) Transcript_40090:674-1414(+)
MAPLVGVLGTQIARVPQFPGNEAPSDMPRQPREAPRIRPERLHEPLLVARGGADEQAADDVVGLPVARELAHLRQDCLGNAVQLLRRAVVEQALDDEVAERVLGQLGDRSQELVDQRGGVLLRTMFEEALEHARNGIVLGRLDGAAPELLGDEAHLGGGQSHHALLEHMVAMRRCCKFPNVAPQGRDQRRPLALAGGGLHSLLEDTGTGRRACQEKGALRSAVNVRSLLQCLKAHLKTEVDLARPA